MRKESGSRWLAMAVIIMAGEAIFLLPFVMPRIFSSLMLDVFSMSKFEFGILRSSYGVVAIFAYFLGGPLADRFRPNRLMAVALCSTALAGFYLATIPDSNNFAWIYAYWGASTIMLFWAVMMRCTRVIGGEQQGFAFGLLDGGRGLTSVLISSVSVWILADQLPEDMALAEVDDKAKAFSNVVLFVTCFVLAVSMLVWIALRNIRTEVEEDGLDPGRVLSVLRIPAVWMQAVMILLAYSCYRVTDNFTILAEDVLGYDDVSSSWLGAMALWGRPIAAISAGLIADRISTSKTMYYAFALLVLAGALIGFGPVEVYAETVVFIGVAATSIAVFALRGLYFAIMGEARIPIAVTGTAVGIASLVGYLPDVYMLPYMGWLNDTFPGVQGHRYIFMSMMLFGLLGLGVTFLFRRRAVS